MTEDDIYRAQRAKDLLSDEVFADALTSVRMDALLSLAEVKATDTVDILRLQAIVHVTEAMKDYLAAAIKKTGTADGGLNFPATRPANKAN